MRFEITLDATGAAFEGGGYRYEVGRILDELAGRIRAGNVRDCDALTDINGNTVGRVRIMCAVCGKPVEDHHSAESEACTEVIHARRQRRADR